MAVNITTAYAGEVLEQLLVRATTGNEIVAGGHIHVQPNVKKKFAIPRLKTGRMLQKRIEQPKEANSSGDFTITEKYLEPQDMMAFTTFNPRVFETLWRPFQPAGALVFRELPADVQNLLLSELAKVVDFELGDYIINCTKGAGATAFFDGILARILADATVVKSGMAAAYITAANVVDVLESVRVKIPKSIRRDPNLKLFVSVEDADFYDTALTKREYKGANWTERNPERYKGIRIVPLVAWPKDVVVAAATSPGIESNFWMGVDYSDDEEVVLIDKLENAGEKYFFKMLMKADTNIVFGEDVVLFDGREPDDPGE
ncbi:MAG: phage major capsid protein [Tannerella sp.]|jgi:hypothetical protein|nr:phage major capsid protein [Tannerella sp.]